MELPEIDSLELKSLQTLIDALFQVLRAAIRDPLVWSGPGVAAFGRDDQSFRIGMERLSDQKLAGFRAIGVRRVDQVHAKIYCPLQNLERLAAILRPTPDPLARNPHCAEPEPVHGQ